MSKVHLKVESFQNNTLVLGIYDRILPQQSIKLSTQTEDGTLATSTATLPSYQGATSSANGTPGLVPSASIADRDKYLKGDGTWSEIANVDTSTLLLDNYQKADSVSAISSSDSVLDAIGKLEKALDGKQASGSYANVTHSHVGTEVTLTGYEKASSASAVAASDTVNAAIGKIEKALDGKQASGSYASSTHIHDASDINSGTLDAARIPSLDASKITTGTIDIARLPAGALPILKIVSNETARFALTSSDVQIGDTVQQTDTGLMYYVKDITKLNSEDGYAVYTAGAATSVPWSGVTGKPSTYAPSAHNHTSSEVNAMTGYSKPSSTSAIGTSDTLNAAIGKLEKALDGKQASGSYANATHSHVGTEVTLTGYSKASSAAAVKATDTVNAAIGKIEKALDGKQASGTYLTPTSTLDAAKLSGTIPSECYTDTVYTHPSTSGNKHIPSGGSSGQFLKWSADGTAAWAADNNSITHLYAGASGATANASSATANNATYLVVCDDSTARSSIQITGTNGTTVSANGGTITIDSVVLSAVTNAQIDTLFA